MQLVAEGGLDALSMQRLAHQVDYTAGALYRYFPSKDAILSRLVARTLDEVDRALQAQLARLPKRATPLQRIAALALGYRLFAQQHPNRFSLLTMTLAVPHILLTDPADAQPVIDKIMGAMQPLALALHDAAQARQLSGGDTVERALCVFASLQGALMLRKQAQIAPRLIDLPRLTSASLRSLLVGWGARERTVDGALRMVARLEPPHGAHA